MWTFATSNCYFCTTELRRREKKLSQIVAPACICLGNDIYLRKHRAAFKPNQAPLEKMTLKLCICGSEKRSPYKQTYYGTISNAPETRVKWLIKNRLLWWMRKPESKGEKVWDVEDGGDEAGGHSFILSSLTDIRAEATGSPSAAVMDDR